MHPKHAEANILLVLTAVFGTAILQLLMLLAFVLIRTLGGSTLNLRGLPVGDATDAPLIGFWLVCKYPPSLAYTTLTVGADLVVLYLFSLMDSGSKVAHVILHYGRSPLAFYISHFYVIVGAWHMVVRHPNCLLAS